MTVIPFPNAPAQPVRQDPDYRMRDESIAEYHARREAREPGWLSQLEIERQESERKMVERAEAKRLRFARPVDTMPAADLWDEMVEHNSYFECQGRLEDGPRYSLITDEIQRRLKLLDPLIAAMKEDR